jgi:hypothetical protein
MLNNLNLKTIYFIAKPFNPNLNASNKSEYDVCSLSSEYSVAYAVLKLVISLSYLEGIARYPFETIRKDIFFGPRKNPTGFLPL